MMRIGLILGFVSSLMGCGVNGDGGAATGAGADQPSARTGVWIDGQARIGVRRGF